MRIVCVRLPRGIRSGHASVDTVGALATHLITLYNPVQPLGLGLGLGYPVKPCHGVYVWRVSGIVL